MSANLEKEQTEVRSKFEVKVAKYGFAYPDYLSPDDVSKRLGVFQGWVNDILSRAEFLTERAADIDLQLGARMTLEQRNKAGISEKVLLEEAKRLRESAEKIITTPMRTWPNSELAALGYLGGDAMSGNDEALLRENRRSRMLREIMREEPDESARAFRFLHSEREALKAKGKTRLVVGGKIS